MVTFAQILRSGTDLVYLALFRVFGPRIWVTNALVLALGMLLAWLCYALSRQLMDRSRAFLAAWLFLVVLYGRLLCATHHWFSTLAVLAATLILMPAITTRRLVAAGSLLGLASFFTQTSGVVAGVGAGVYLFWEARQRRCSVAMMCRHAGLLVVAFGVSLTLLNAYFIRSVDLGLLWDFQVSYVARDVTRIDKTGLLDLGLPHVLTLHNVPALAQYLAVYIAAPLACGIVLLQRALVTRQQSPPTGPGTKDPVLLLSLVASALLAEVATDISWLRLYCVAMPCIVLLIWLIGQTPLPSDSPSRTGGTATQGNPLRAAAPFFLGAVIVTLGVQQVWSRQTTQEQLLHLPGGTAVMSADAAERFSWLSEHTSPGEPFLHATWPSAYLPLALRDPVYLDVFSTNRMTQPEWVALSVKQLEQHPIRYIIVGSALEDQQKQRPAEDHLAPFIKFLNDRYRLIRTFSNGDRVWERRSERD